MLVLLICAVTLATPPSGVASRMRIDPIPAPPLGALDINNNLLELTDLAGKVVILDLMSSTCRPCFQLARHTLHPFYASHHANDRVAIVSLSVSDSVERLRLFSRNHNFTWLHATNPSGELVVSYGAYYVPKVVFINPAGEWSYTYTPRQFGRLMVEHLEDIVATLLNESSSANSTTEKVEMPINDTVVKDEQIEQVESEMEPPPPRPSPILLHKHTEAFDTPPEPQPEPLPPSLDDADIWAFALGAGALMFFSPCSFPLLGGYISFYLTQALPRRHPSANPLSLHQPDTPPRSWLAAGISSSSGLLLSLSGLGIVAIPFGGALGALIPIAEPAVAVVLILSGLSLIFDWDFSWVFDSISFSIKSFGRNLLRKLRGSDGSDEADPVPPGVNGRGLWELFWFGVGYGFTSAGCNLPVLMALFVLSTRQSMTSMTITVLLYAGSAATLMVTFTGVVALGVWLSHKNIKIKLPAHRVRQFGGLGMAVVGLNMLRLMV